MYMDTRHPPLNTMTRTCAEAQQLARETVAVVLAGGKGSRLGALTRHECKPALPFGVRYRNIDFSLSNCVNSGIYRIGVATQYKDASLIQHLARVWRHAGEPGEGFIEPWRAELRSSGGSYRGTADAVLQNWDRIEALRAQLVLILAGDHVYKMDYRPVLMRHLANRADVTVGCVEIPLDSARDFGVMSIDHEDRISSFREKPQHPQCLPGKPDRALGSMGIYVFNRALLGRLLQDDAITQTSSHDFGHDILPRLIDKARVFAYAFTQNAAVGAGYWRDVGTITSYWRTHMELLDGIPGFRLDDASWPLRSEAPSPETSSADANCRGWPGAPANSQFAECCEADQVKVHHSVLFPNVSVARGSELSNAVVLPQAEIGRNCSLHDVVIGAGARVPDGTVIAPMRLRDGAGAPAPSLFPADTRGIDRQPVNPRLPGGAAVYHASAA